MKSHRDTSAPLQLNDFVLDAQIPAETSENGDASKLRSAVLDLTMMYEEEMSIRFVETDTEVWSTMKALSPNHLQFCEATALAALFECILYLPPLKCKFP